MSHVNLTRATWQAVMARSVRKLPVAAMATFLISLFVSAVAGIDPNSAAAIVLQNMKFLQIKNEGEETKFIAETSELSSWSGSDPCQFTGIRCEGGEVVEIDLSDKGIIGQLEENFGEISTLQILRLRNNSFAGTLPQSMSKLSLLSLIDISYNDFNGIIPDFFSNLSNLNTPTSVNFAQNFFEAPLNESLKNKFCSLQFEGNPGLGILNASEFTSCDPPVFTSIEPKESNNIGAIVGGVVGGAFLFFIITFGILAYFFFFRKTDFQFKPLSQEDIVEIEAGLNGSSLSRLRRFSFQELIEYTDNFSEENRLGEGGFAIVYKGVIPETGEEIAIKRSKENRIGKKEMLDFLNEVDLISRAGHRNVLKLEGICIDKGERIMVNPFMPHGSVRDHLQKRSSGIPPLSLQLRRRIAIGAAEGLAYLHDDCETRIIHRDVKAANILLNARYEAVVADFGLAKEINDMETHLTTVVRGTFGHIAPEYISTGKTSEKSDVYSFGVFLLEMVTGKDASELSQEPEAKDGLKSWFSSSFQEGRLSQMIDIELRLIDIEVVEGEYQTEVLEDMVQVALLCLTEDVNMRPSMAECIRLLQGDGLEKAWTLWQKQDSEIRTSAYEWDVPGSMTATSSSSKTGTGTASDMSVIGYNLSGPR